MSLESQKKTEPWAQTAMLSNLRTSRCPSGAAYRRGCSSRVGEVRVSAAAAEWIATR